MLVLRYLLSIGAGWLSAKINSEGLVMALSTTTEVPEGSTSLLPLQKQNSINLDNVIPEIAEVSKTSFKLHRGKVTVSLRTTSGDVLQFMLGYDKFLVGVTAAVAFMNQYLSNFFDLAGMP